jgi:threonylcarbamoyladenosine tRNA methylthiotransferase MtaB
LRRLSKKKRFEFDTSFTGGIRPVLFERPNENGIMYGWTDNYIRMGISANPQYENKILPVRLGDRARGGYLIGTLTEEARQQEEVIAELVG